MQLGNHDALGTIHDEGTAIGDHRHFAHQDFFVFERTFLAKAELQENGDGESRALTDALELVRLRHDQAVLEILETEVAVVAFNRESFAKHGIEADVLAASGRHVELEEVVEGEDLILNQVRWGDDFA